MPIENLLRNELRTDVEEYIFNKPFYGNEYINVPKVKEYVSSFLKGDHNNGWGVWHVYSWQKWANYHVTNT